MAGTVAAVTCPRCQNPKPTLLASTSQVALVDYYRCDICGLVWNQPKTGEGPINIVNEGE